MQLSAFAKYLKYLILISIITCILFTLNYFIVIKSNRLIWETRSPNEIESYNHEIVPLLDSEVEIPKYNGKNLTLILQFSQDHFMSDWHFRIYNDGSIYYKKKFMKVIPLSRVQEIISKLNAIGLYDVRGDGIIHKLFRRRRITILDVFKPERIPPEMPVSIDGGTITFKIYRKNSQHNISFYNIYSYAREFPKCQDIQIFLESIDYLTSTFSELLGIPWIYLQDDYNVTNEKKF